MDLAGATFGLEIAEDGVWYSREARRVSYPEEGNEWCFGVEDESYWFEHRNKCIAALLANFPPGGTAIDIGGGNGLVASIVQAAGIDVVVGEPGADGAGNARRRAVANVICASLEGAGFQHDALRAIVPFDVIEHIEDDAEFLAALKRLMIPGGRIYISAPAYNALWSGDDKSAGHFRRYTIRGHRTRLVRAGLSVEFATCIFSLLPLPIFLLRTLPWRLGLRKTIVLEEDRQKHRLPTGPPSAALGKILGTELELIRKRRVVPLGGSCLLVARRGPGGCRGE